MEMVTLLGLKVRVELDVVLIVVADDTVALTWPQVVLAPLDEQTLMLAVPAVTPYRVSVEPLMLVLTMPELELEDM